MFALVAIALMSGASLLQPVPALAANTNNAGRPMMGREMMKGPFVAGTVSAVQGTTITVNGHSSANKDNATANYQVDASNAKVMKDKASSNVSSIAVGDNVLVQGTLSGNTITATNILDGMKGPMGMKHEGRTDTDFPTVTGNGEPVVAGTITSISGNDIVVTNKSNVSYSIDATNAKVMEGATAGTVANLQTGEMVVVQGTVSGHTVVASTIIHNKHQAGATNSSNSTPAQPGFFGRIGGFFSRLFGF